MGVAWRAFLSRTHEHADRGLPQPLLRALLQRRLPHRSTTQHNPVLQCTAGSPPRVGTMTFTGAEPLLANHLQGSGVTSIRLPWQNRQLRKYGLCPRRLRALFLKSVTRSGLQFLLRHDCVSVLLAKSSNSRGASALKAEEPCDSRTQSCPSGSGQDRRYSGSSGVGMTLRQGWEEQGSEEAHIKQALGGASTALGNGDRRQGLGNPGKASGSEGHTAHLRLAARSAGLLDSVLGRSRVSKPDLTGSDTAATRRLPAAGAGVASPGTTGVSGPAEPGREAPPDHNPDGIPQMAQGTPGYRRTAAAGPPPRPVRAQDRSAPSHTAALQGPQVLSRNPHRNRGLEAAPRRPTAVARLLPTPSTDPHTRRRPWTRGLPFPGTGVTRNPAAGARPAASPPPSASRGLAQAGTHTAQQRRGAPARPRRRGGPPRPLGRVTRSAPRSRSRTHPPPPPPPPPPRPGRKHDCAGAPPLGGAGRNHARGGGRTGRNHARRGGAHRTEPRAAAGGGRTGRNHARGGGAPRGKFADRRSRGARASAAAPEARVRPVRVPRPSPGTGRGGGEASLAPGGGPQPHPPLPRAAPAGSNPRLGATPTSDSRDTQGPGNDPNPPVPRGSPFPATAAPPQPRLRPREAPGSPRTTVVAGPACLRPAQSHRGVFEQSPVGGHRPFPRSDLGARARAGLTRRETETERRAGASGPGGAIAEGPRPLSGAAARPKVARPSRRVVRATSRAAARGDATARAPASAAPRPPGRPRPGPGPAGRRGAWAAARDGADPCPPPRFPLAAQARPRRCVRTGRSCAPRASPSRAPASVFPPTRRSRRRPRTEPAGPGPCASASFRLPLRSRTRRRARTRAEAGSLAAGVPAPGLPTDGLSGPAGAHAGPATLGPPEPLADPEGGTPGAPGAPAARLRSRGWGLREAGVPRAYLSPTCGLNPGRGGFPAATTRPRQRALGSAGSRTGSASDDRGPHGRATSRGRRRLRGCGRESASPGFALEAACVSASAGARVGVGAWERA
ncbi:collagen alpha-1(I) chain-like [Neovison vison]|uniref:collagen alpha-1(I) chain-like n=1 Tax=Neovison vison TaxID=452646 RepID=UPI001CF07AA4|nr:collagen alpha-1(I) chain-like [Neogale vison]